MAAQQIGDQAVKDLLPVAKFADRQDELCEEREPQTQDYDEQDAIDKNVKDTALEPSHADNLPPIDEQ
jgi:hypothetical protein